MAEIKHITGTCPVDGCDHKAFVQVLVLKDKELQKKVDAKARRKLKKQLTDWHKEGVHNG